MRYVVAPALLLLGGAVMVALDGSPEEAEYVGQASCVTADCHEGPYGGGYSYAGFEEFSRTMHQQIHLRPSPETVVIDHLFEKDTVIRAEDLDVRAKGKDTLLIRLYKEAGDYLIGMKYSGGGDSLPPMKVEYTYGGNGWIQRFLVKVDDSYYVPPFWYVLPGYRERPGGGAEKLAYSMDFPEGFIVRDLVKWRDIDRSVEEAQFYDWTSNTFRKFSWDKNCTACHVNGFDFTLEIDGEDSTWISHWVGKDSGDSAMMDQNILIGCESCHGPGSEHVENPTADNIVAPRTWEGFAGTDLKLDLCGQCHARFKSADNEHGYAYDPVAGRPYVPGQLLDDFIRTRDGDAQTWADGLTSVRHHQTSNDYKRSKPYQEHVFVDGCWSCHLVHRQIDSLPYMLDRDWYSLQEGEGCLTGGCHDGYSATVDSAGGVYNVHTRHTPGASACVNCHFTKTATLSYVEFEFSDHSFHVIRPIETRNYKNSSTNFGGMLNTCAASCHRNGRGTRNPNPEQKEAPDFGVTDQFIQFWDFNSDVELADSLWYHYQRMYGSIMSVRETGRAEGSRVESIFPNPASDEAAIIFSLDRRSAFALTVYDITGQPVRALDGGTFDAGRYRTRWDGCDDRGGPVPNGTYFVRLEIGDVVSAHKVVIRR